MEGTLLKEQESVGGWIGDKAGGKQGVRVVGREGLRGGIVGGGYGGPG